MKTYKIEDNHAFMSKLLKSDLFDTFLFHSGELKTFASFQIDGHLNKEYFTLEEQEKRNTPYCLWKEIKPYLFQLIKGNKTPSYIKLVFSLPEDEASILAPNASALFLNLFFQNGSSTIVTGCSQKEFSLDRTLDYIWDSACLDLLKQKGIPVSEESVSTQL